MRLHVAAVDSNRSRCQLDALFVLDAPAHIARYNQRLPTLYHSAAAPINIASL